MQRKVIESRQNAHLFQEMKIRDIVWTLHVAVLFFFKLTAFPLHIEPATHSAVNAVIIIVSIVCSIVIN